jgi:DNA ligase-1
MNEILNIIAALEATTKRSDKDQILMDAFMSKNYQFFIGLQYAYDSMITFGVKKVPLIEDTEEIEGTLTFDQFIALCDQLAARKLTGNAAKTAINNAAMACDANLWNNFFRRILLKDMRCGIDVSSINKVLTKLSISGGDRFLVPTFECQSGYDVNKHPKKMVGQKMIDTKMDGARCLAVIDPVNMTAKLYTRTGNDIVNYPHIERALLNHFAPAFDQKIVLDGELMADTFKGVMEQLNRKKNVDTSTSRYCVFDIIPYDHFAKGQSPITQIERHQMLMALHEQFTSSGGVVSLTPKMMINLDTEEGRLALKEYNKTVLENGFEGVMIKDPFAPYICKKNTNWLKLKPFIEVSLKVVGLLDGDENKKFSDVVGSLVCEGEDEGVFYKAQVSSGISEEERALWKADPNLVLGLVAEIIAMESDFVEKGNYYSLRHPRLKGFRGFKKGEKI